MNYETIGRKIKRRITNFLTRQNESEDRRSTAIKYWKNSKSNTITNFRWSKAWLIWRCIKGPKDKKKNQ